MGNREQRIGNGEPANESRLSAFSGSESLVLGSRFSICFSLWFRLGRARRIRDSEDMRIAG